MDLFFGARSRPPRRNHSAAFKAKVALQAVRGDLKEETGVRTTEGLQFLQREEKRLKRAIN